MPEGRGGGERDSRDALLHRISEVVDSTRDRGDVVLVNDVARELGMTREAFRRKLRSHGLGFEDVDLLAPRDEIRMFYISIGEIFQGLGLPFNARSIAEMLHKHPTTVFDNINIDPELRTTLEHMGFEMSLRRMGKKPKNSAKGR